MTTISFDIVGFDLDGTLVDTSRDLTNAVNFALGEAGRPPLSHDQVETMIGGGAKHMFSQAMAATGGCEPHEFRRLYKLLLGYYEAHIAVESKPYPGAIEALDDLAATGSKIAVVTNKFESFAEKLLTALKMRDHFACVIGGDTLGPGKAKPDRAPIDEMIRRCGGEIGRTRAIFVGDSAYDVMAAHNAGIPAVAVRFGFLTGPVEELGADAVLDSYADLPAVLERLSS